MSMINKWVRIIHRWLAVPLMTAMVILIFGTIQQGENFILPDWLNGLGLVSILSLVLTGIYLFSFIIWRSCAGRGTASTYPYRQRTNIYTGD